MSEYSAAVKAARSRRSARAGGTSVDVEWFTEMVAKRVDLTMTQRMTIATNYLRDKVVQNISRPVTKTPVTRTRSTRKGPRGSQYTLVTNRSKAGEFPKADTTQLRKTIFQDVRERQGIVDGFVGTPLHYGLILEVSKRLKRSFLRRTLMEELSRLRRMLGAPMK